jgi:dolichol-phosphate mannosyltransferase
MIQARIMIVEAAAKPPAARPLIVVPTYNEADNVDELLDGIAEHAPGADVLFVDDNSGDGTVDRIRARQAAAPGRIHLLQRPGKLGLGTAYVAGFRWALARDYDPVQEMDADLSHDPRYLPAIHEACGRHDVVIGSRYVPGGGTVNWGPSRRFLSGFGNLYARAILGLAVRDLTGGFNAWRRRVLETVSLDGVRSEGYAFQIELKYRAAEAGFSLHEIPIVFADRRVGQSKMSAKVALEAMTRVWALRLGR